MGKIISDIKAFAKGSTRKNKSKGIQNIAKETGYKLPKKKYKLPKKKKKKKKGKKKGLGISTSYELDLD